MLVRIRIHVVLPDDRNQRILYPQKLKQLANIFSHWIIRYPPWKLIHGLKFWWLEDEMSLLNNCSFSSDEFVNLVGGKITWTTTSKVVHPYQSARELQPLSIDVHRSSHLPCHLNFWTWSVQTTHNLVANFLVNYKGKRSSRVVSSQPCVKFWVESSPTVVRFHPLEESSHLEK